MTGAELKALSALLLEMAGEFEGHSSNDWMVPGTKENKAIVEAAIRYNHGLGGEGLEEPLEKTDDGEWFIWDDWLMRYLEERCNPGEPPLSEAEAAMVGDLLEMIAEDTFNLLVDDERIAEVEYLAARAKGEREVAPEFDGPAVTPPESIPTADRPGVSERWVREWKSTLRNSDEWFEASWPEERKALDEYARSGKSDIDYQPSPVNPPYHSWERVGFLPITAVLYLWKWERSGAWEGRWDAEAVTSAFMTSYLAAGKEHYTAAMSPRRHPGSNEHYNVDLDMPFVALGFVLGLAQRAEFVARLNLAAVRKGWFNPDFVGPISAFIVRLLADYFGQAPIALKGDRELQKGRVPADPIMQKLLDVWRTPDPAVLAPRLTAALDVHTHQSLGGASGSGLEFNNGTWTRTPIAVLLVLKLREMLGLANPSLEHPLTNTIVGRLPSGPATGPADELLMKVEMRMRKDGFDEKKVLAAYGMP